MQRLHHHFGPSDYCMAGCSQLALRPLVKLSPHSIIWLDYLFYPRSVIMITHQCSFFLSPAFLLLPFIFCYWSSLIISPNTFEYIVLFGISFWPKTQHHSPIHPLPHYLLSCQHSLAIFALSPLPSVGLASSPSDFRFSSVGNYRLPSSSPPNPFHAFQLPPTILLLLLLPIPPEQTTNFPSLLILSFWPYGVVPIPFIFCPEGIFAGQDSLMGA